MARAVRRPGDRGRRRPGRLEGDGRGTRRTCAVGAPSTLSDLVTRPRFLAYATRKGRGSPWHGPSTCRSRQASGRCRRRQGGCHGKDGAVSRNDPQSRTRRQRASDRDPRAPARGDHRRLPAGARRGVYVKADQMPGFARVRWGDEEARIAEGAGNYAEEDYCADIRGHGSLVCEKNICRAGSDKFACNDI